MLRLLKYILFAVLIVAVLNFVPNLNISRDNMLAAVIVGTAILAVLDRLMDRPTEGMEEVAMLEEVPEELLMDEDEAEEMPMQEVPMEQAEGKCEDGYRVPNAYELTDLDEDVAKTGLHNNNNSPQEVMLQKGQFNKYMMGFDKVRKVIDQQRYNYDVHGPGYYLMNNGEFSQNGVPYSKAKDIICSSKLHDLYNQHNFNYKWTPHTHLGKSRGYMNWEQTYE